MNNTWIIVPVTKNDIDLTSFVNKLSGGYVAPATYEKTIFDPLKSIEESEVENIDHPYAGQNGPDFTNKIIFVNMVSGYTEYDGVIHLESFGEINIPRLMNTGIDYAQSNGAEHIVVLSNPCDFDPFVIEEAISSNIDKEIINISDGVFFILSGSLSLRLNEDLQVWFWSEDIYRTAPVEKIGGCRPEYMFLSELIPLIVNTVDLESITKEDEEKYSTKWS